MPVPDKEFGPADRLTEDTGTWRFKRCVVIVPGVVRPASAWVVLPRLKLVHVAVSGLEGGMGVHIGSDSLEDGQSLCDHCRLRGTWPCTEGSLSGGGRSPSRLAYESWCYDADLSAFCTTACSRNPRSPWRTLLPSGVNGLGIALRSSVAPITFWLAKLKRGGSSPSASSMMR